MREIYDKGQVRKQEENYRISATYSLAREACARLPFSSFPSELFPNHLWGSKVPIAV